MALSRLLEGPAHVVQPVDSIPFVEVTVDYTVQARTRRQLRTHSGVRDGLPMKALWEAAVHTDETHWLWGWSGSSP